MTDAYRTAGFRCPSCGEGTPLREFGNRLVCDACDGILLPVDDFASQVPGGEVKVIDDGGATRECPRCQRPMRGCVLDVRGRHLDAALVRCEQHGIWFGDDSLAAVYAEIGSGGMSAHGPRRGDGGFGHMYGGTIGRTFVRPRKLPPREHSAPVPPSALRDRPLPCADPGCGARALRYDVSRWTCQACKGLFVENAALEALVGEMAGEPWQIPPPSGAPGRRRCPACAGALTVEDLEGVTVDRCAEHGVWFDPTELEAALQHAAGVEVEVSAGRGSWLRRLFSRS